jgi:pimeloyl-ACP methyl ester carboxylesterase
MFDYLLRDPKSIGVEERAVYKAAYAGEEAIRAGNAWYQAFTQDAIDMKSYPKLAMPVLGLGSTGYEWLEASLPSKAIDVELVRVEDSGHYLAEEQPAFVAAELLRFFE